MENIIMINKETIKKFIKEGYFVNCEVEWHHSALLVKFNCDKCGSPMSLLLLSNWTQVQFCVDTGFLKAPENWDGSPSSIPEWEDFEPTEITGCPKEYFEQADYGWE